MAAAGTYDRLINIQRPTQVQSTSGQMSVIWESVFTDLPARILFESGGQGFENEQRVSTNNVRFQVRYEGVVLEAGHRVTYEGNTYNVVYVAEVGRRVAYELRCILKDNQ